MVTNRIVSQKRYLSNFSDCIPIAKGKEPVTSMNRGEKAAE